MIEAFAKLIPDHLLGESGKAFYSGRDAFGHQSPLYILGLNPGGDPRAQAEETIARHTKIVLLEKPNDWGWVPNAGTELPRAVQRRGAFRSGAAVHGA